MRKLFEGKLAEGNNLEPGIWALSLLFTNFFIY